MLWVWHFKIVGVWFRAYQNWAMGASDRPLHLQQRFWGSKYSNFPFFNSLHKYNDYEKYNNNWTAKSASKRGWIFTFLTSLTRKKCGGHRLGGPLEKRTSFLYWATLWGSEPTLVLFFHKQQAVVVGKQRGGTIMNLKSQFPNEEFDSHCSVV